MLAWLYFLKQETRYGVIWCLEFRRVLFRSAPAQRGPALLRLAEDGVREQDRAEREHRGEHRGRARRHDREAPGPEHEREQIGRASCRERAWGAGPAVAVARKLAPRGGPVIR